ncbi:c6 and c2h2 transcription factor [Trichoderma arundinaceum]|uniref:pH-response transcription factor pacC/RIM101 n=1 Tax=Trichoderma arundinaceum TaxID=490622 RepID=A0A395NZC5_TRIAR|nr:c6 and c2h2 transcription factor [Trichoderma arundinaceum]
MAGPSLSHILDPMGPGSDPRPLPARVPVPVLPPPFPLAHRYAADATRTADSALSNPTGQSHITMQAVPSSRPGPLSAAPGGGGGGATAAAAAGVTNGVTPETTTSTSAAAAAASASSQSQGQSHQNNNPYACRDCGRSYSRPEHLVRHVQTHTLGRRFACEICKKSFARKDLLRRHVTNHENDSPKKRQRMVSTPNSSRVTQACRACASARVKCDESKPCRRCVSRNLQCSSYETSPGTSMHLVHLPASGQDAALTQPTGTSSVGSTDSSSALQNASASVIRDNVTAKSSPLSQSASSRQDDSQLTTPDTGIEQGVPRLTAIPPFSLVGNAHSPAQPHDPPKSGPMELNNVPFFDFLRDVLYQQPLDLARPSESQGPAVLDFCDDMDMDLTEMDFGLLDHWNLDMEDGSALITPTMGNQNPQNSVEMSAMRQNLANVWGELPWKWEPTTKDNAYTEQANLPLSTKDISNAHFQETKRQLERVVEQRLNLPSRDQILAIVLKTCRDASMAGRVAASFPTVEVMDAMVQTFLAAHLRQVSTWIHYPTLKLNAVWPEWIGNAVAAGAVLMPASTLRKFGFAVQEAVRITIPARFEDNNTAIQNLSLVQSLILGQDIGIWSGNRRKMEIAECHLMMRYRRMFQRCMYPTITVEPSDEGDVLEQKWMKWAAAEQWKRLVFHCYIREAQISMTVLTNPCMSYAELTLPLPERKDLWFAKNASEWKSIYLSGTGGQNPRAPSIADMYRDVRQFAENSTRIDMQLSVSIFLHGFWSMILEYSQLSVVHQYRSYTKDGSNPMLSSRRQELMRELQSFQFISSSLQDISPQEHVVLYLLLMHLHVSLDDLQIFSGKQGEEEARRMYPILQQWTASPESWYAVWCAAQVLRYAKLFPLGSLRDFYAIAVHHAALALWTYGVVVRASQQQDISSQYGYEPMYLDEGSDATSIQPFLSFGQGRPLIQGPTGLSSGAVPGDASIYDPRACMDIAQEILQANFRRSQDALPPLVENLCQLIKQLGNAAWAVGLG